MNEVHCFSRTRWDPPMSRLHTRATRDTITWDKQQVGTEMSVNIIHRICNTSISIALLQLTYNVSNFSFYLQKGAFKSQFPTAWYLWRVICMLFVLRQPCFDGSLFYYGKCFINYSWKCQCISKSFLWTQSSTQRRCIWGVHLLCFPWTFREHFSPPINVKW